MVFAAYFGDLPYFVFVAKQMLHFLIENLPGKLARLLQHHAAVFGVSVVAEIRAFVDEAPAGCIDQDAERIRVLLELIADRKIAEFRCIHLPLHGMTTRPVAARAGADRERHTNAVAGVKARAAHLGEIPSRPKITRAPFRIGFETAAGEHHGRLPAILGSTPSLRTSTPSIRVPS